LKAGAENHIIPEWEMGLRPSPVVYLRIEIRIVSDQLVRVFLQVNVTANGFLTIAITSVRSARLSPQPGEPIFPGSARWQGASASADIQS
jgi:hypothetical protein